MQKFLTRPILAVLLSAGTVVPTALAATPSPKPVDSAQVIADEAKLDSVDDEVTSIAQQVAVVQASLKVIADKQADLGGKVDALNAESAKLLPELKAKQAAFDRRQKQLLELISLDYKTPATNAFFVAVGSKSLSESLDQATYEQTMTEKVNETAQALAQSRDDLDAQKRTIDGKRSSLEVYQREQSQLKAGADQQNAKLKELLANRANEAAYLAAKIAAEKAQQDSLLSATSAGGANLGTYTEGASVHQGDPIGLEGSTGNSTGCHTHFSVIKDGRWIDPAPFLTAGVLRRPDGAISQGFGMTEHALSGAYGGAIHNGVDFVQPCGAQVRAAADGVIIRDNRTDGSGFGHYIMIRHSNGLITLYGHLI